MKKFMRTTLWAFMLGMGNGIKAGIIGALAYIVTHGILSSYFETRDSGSIIFLTLISLHYGVIIGSILGAIVGGISGLLLTLIRATRYAPVIGSILGGLIGWYLGMAPPFPPATGMLTNSITAQWYFSLARILAALCGAFGGFLGGNYYHTSFLKRVTERKPG